jgi:hypothetical protein
MRIRIRIRIQIQGFDDQRLEKIYSRKKITLVIFFGSKISIYLYLGLQKEPPSYRRSLYPSKETSSKSKLESSSSLWVVLALLDLDLYSQCGSGSSRPK